jgi:hypothetical protein
MPEVKSTHVRFFLAPGGGRRRAGAGGEERVFPRARERARERNVLCDDTTIKY